VDHEFTIPWKVIQTAMWSTCKPWLGLQKRMAMKLFFFFIYIFIDFLHETGHCPVPWVVNQKKIDGGVGRWTLKECMCWQTMLSRTLERERELAATRGITWITRRLLDTSAQIGYRLKLAYFTTYYCGFKEGYLELSWRMNANKKWLFPRQIAILWFHSFAKSLLPIANGE
jgi:hypothetical protein